MKKYLKIVFVASEVGPFSKTGGLADVCRSLPKALARLGHSVLVITPLYGTINKRQSKLRIFKKNVPIKIDKTTTIKVNYWKGELMSSVPVYFIENYQYFGKYKLIYGSKYDNNRFLIFDLACLKLILLLKLKTDIVHCHDWQSGLVPYYIQTFFKKNPYLEETATLFTIHNLIFQMGKNWWEVPPQKRDNGHFPLPPFKKRKQAENINFAKRAILSADIISTVSEEYAEEILTKEAGQGLDRTLQKRKNKLFGVVNGIDYFDYNPTTDPGLFKNYSVKTLRDKLQNKISLQKEYKLPVNTTIPLIGMASRITEQKGFDLIIEIMDVLMRMNLQMVIMGGGEKKYEHFFAKMAKKHPKKFAAHLKFDSKKATQVYAGSDMFLMPSRFEPCGLGQLISLRYGSIPIVRATGGLADTITDFKPQIEKGNGFIFKQYNSRDLLVAITRALETFKHKKTWQRLMESGMKQSFSWEIPARKYVTLYRKAINLKKQEKNNK